MTTGRETVLKAATDAVMRDRNAEYAPPEQNFARIRDLWNTYLEGRTITSYDVAIMCGLIKVARCISSPQQIDHLVDLAGYAACAGDIVVAGEPVPVPVPEEDVAPVRAVYEGEPGQFNEPGADTWYADAGRKVTLTPEQWGQAVAAGALTYEEEA